MTEPNISPKKFTEDDLKKVRKAVTTLYFLGNDIFQSVEKIKQEQIDKEDMDVLRKGVYNVASNGQINNDVVKYVDSQVKALIVSSGSEDDGDDAGEGEGEGEGVELQNAASTLSTEEVVNDEPEVGDAKDTTLSTDNTDTDNANKGNDEVTVADVKGILEDVKKSVKQKDGDEQGFTIEDSNDEKLTPVIDALKAKGLEKDPTIFIDKAIESVNDDKIVEGNTAQQIAAKLVTAATDTESVEEVEDSVVDNANGKNQPVSVEAVTKILEAVEKLVKEEDGEGEAKVFKIEDSEEEKFKDIIDYLKEKMADEQKHDIKLLLKNAIAAVSEDNITKDQSAEQIAFALVKKSIVSPTAEPAENSDDAANDLTDNNKSAKPIEVTIAEVTTLLETKDLVTATGEGDEDKTYTIITSDDDNLKPIIEALQKKLEAKKESNLEQVLKNAIAATKIEGYEIPDDNKETAADIAAKLIEAADDQVAKAGGKPNKYVYGGKTVRAYPKNISFSKKNPSKKKHNKKTIRKLQKLMNKRK